MFLKRVIPCLDFFDGRIVKGIKFKNLIDIGDPISVSKFYNDEGADEIIFLDISATIENRSQILYYIHKISSIIFIPLIVGGGIKSIIDINNLLNSGADKIALNSFIINNFDFLNEVKDKYGSQCIIGSLDLKRNYTKFLFNNWILFKNSGKKYVDLNVFDIIIKFIELGIGEFLITSIDKDGTNNGFDIQILNKLSCLSSVSIIASGGMGNLNNLIELFKIKNINAILASSIFHTKKYKILDIKKFLFNNGFNINI